MSGTCIYDRPIMVIPPLELSDLVPRYLERRETDAEEIETAIACLDMETVRLIGHRMKGSGGGYGFDGITDIGMRLEEAGYEGDAGAARRALADLHAYLRNVEVRRA